MVEQAVDTEKERQEGASTQRSFVALLPVVILQIVLAVVSLNAGRMIDVYPEPGVGELFAFALLGSTIYAELAFCLLIAALVGRHWLIGFFAGCALLMCQLALVMIGLNSYESYSGYSELLGICCIPAGLLLAVGPLLATRRIWGWCITSSEVEGKRRFGIEDLFLATLVVACCVVAFRFPFSIWSMDMPEDEGSLEGPAWLSAVIVGGTAAVASLFTLLPILLIWFRSRSMSAKVVATLAQLFLTCFVITLAYYVSDRLTNGTAATGKAIPFGVSVTLPSMLVLLLHLSSLHWAGMRLRCLRLSNELTPESSGQPFAQDEAKTTGTGVSKSKHWLTIPRFIALCVLCLTMGGAIFVNLKVRAFEQREELREELRRIAESKGGYFSEVIGDRCELGLWEGAEESDLAQFDSFELMFLNLTDSKISAKSLTERPNLTTLHGITLSGTSDIRASLELLLGQAPELSSVKISNTSLTPAVLAPLFLASDRELQLQLDLRDSKFSPASTRWQEYHSPVQRLHAPGCGLTDDMIRGWVGRYAGIVDLSDNNLNGDFDFWNNEFELPVWGRQVILSNNPLQDEVFGSRLVGVDIPCLVLKETALTDQFFSYLMRAKSICALELGDGNFTEEALAAAKPVGLEQLSLESKRFSGHCFRDWHPDLTYLSLQNSSA
ncbi:MAG: hypothetical protein AAF483_19665, partial [Planctomycetota bacterium]